MVYHFLARYLIVFYFLSFQATVQAHGYVKVDPRWISLPASLRSLYKQEAGSAPAKHDIPIPRQAAVATLVPGFGPSRTAVLRCGAVRYN